MVSTVEITPHPALTPYIRRYVYREFNTAGNHIVRHWFASAEMSIHFFFKALPLKLTDPVTGEIVKKGNPCDVVGMSSQYNGEMHLNGIYSFFEIIFLPDGFYRLFHVPSTSFVNRIVVGEDVFNKDINLLHEQLYEAGTAIAMGKLANSFLLRQLAKGKPVSYDRISNASQLIARNAGFINVNALAQNANMSMRNFERLFNTATGMSPKQLCCITRFNRALEIKLQNLEMSWTSVAHETGYFDQMHLIKDFKRFSGNRPKVFCEKNSFFSEIYTYVSQG